MINRCIGCYYHDNKENVCTHESPIFLEDVCTDYQDSEFLIKIRNKALDDYEAKIKECCSIVGSCGYEDLKRIKEEIKNDR